MGIAARERFLDRADTALIHFPKAVNDRHSAVLSNLDRFRTNIMMMIETGAW